MEAGMKKTTTFLLAALMLLLVGTSTAETAQNLNAIHDPGSRAYDSRCLSCHAAVLKATTTDPRILTFHQSMLPYVPGYNARKGPQDTNCVMCHRDAIDFDQESGSALRRTVSVESCVYCHGRSGPGPKYYE
jgi:cytochrome c553